MDQFQDDRNRRKKTSSVSEKSKFDQNIQGPPLISKPCLLQSQSPELRSDPHDVLA